MALTSKLAAIGDAIRAKTGKTGKLTLAQMPTEIASIQTGSSDEPFPFGGMNAELISTYSESWTLADTSFVIGSSASTSATTIRAAVSNRYTNTTGSPTVAYGDDDIVVVQRCLATPVHGSGAVAKAMQLNYAYCYVSYFSKRKTTDTSARTTRQVYNLTGSMNRYYNASGNMTRAVASYGFYFSPSAPTPASTTAASTYIRCSTPVLSYRVSSTYESADNIKKVTDCVFDWTVEVYRVKKDSSPCCVMNEAIDAMLTGGAAILSLDEPQEDTDE